ncbi:TetR/AcrR family transcriptional regulator [Allosphingosinicella deserti]|uniref:TetR family transcriptional regulator n=1 Tax=Allosphingosinicella deserti TaxID=2116704 RepID=A0A2P7QKF4_9SPHN|nr:TetR/AcrR family transcriptional regulator [Sphingomonas deserti]PSJ38457.1 TetR family transcriptional regulator [Sphingomonas deserti]
MDEKVSHKERTRARILDEAAKAMRTHGSEGIGVAALMKRAGLTHGGFYAHFASRDDLVVHAIERMFQDSRALVDRHLGGGDAREGLSSLIDAYLSDALLRTPDRGCPLPGLSGEVSRLPAGARVHFQESMKRFRSGIARALSAMGVADADRLAASALAEMVGAMSLARATSDEAEARRSLAASRDALKRRLGLDQAL